MKKQDTYGGTIPWIGIHMIDLMRFTSGREMTEAFGYRAQIKAPAGIGEMENTTGSVFRLDNQGVAMLHMDWRHVYSNRHRHMATTACVWRAPKECWNTWPPPV